MRVGIDIVQPHPDAEFAERFRKVDRISRAAHGLSIARRIFDVNAIGRRVLRDHQQFLHAGVDQLFGFAQDVGRRPRDEVAAQLRNDAETATVVAAFRNLQIGVVTRRELDALRRHEIDIRVVLRRQRAMHGVEDALILLRAGDREQIRILRGDLLRLCAHAAGHDHLAVRRERVADGRKRLGLRAFEKTAGVDDGDVRSGVIAR